MNSFLRSTTTAAFIAVAIQCFTVGVLSPKLPRQVCRPGVERVVAETYPAARLVRVRQNEGAVSVRTHSLAEVQLMATIGAYVRSSEARAATETYINGNVLRVAEQGDVLEVVSEPEDRPEGVYDLMVDYTLLVPEGTDVDVEVISGNVWIQAGCGDVTVNGVNTDILIDQPKGAVRAQSTTGRIEVNGAAQETVLETYNGRVYATIHGGTLLANTTNGAIEANLADPGVRRCDLNTKNGGITLTMADACSAEVHAVTRRGSVNSELPVSPLQAEPRQRELRGMIGAGATKLNLSALNGSIAITRSRT